MTLQYIALHLYSTIVEYLFDIILILFHEAEPPMPVPVNAEVLWWQVNLYCEEQSDGRTWNPIYPESPTPLNYGI